MRPYVGVACAVWLCAFLTTAHGAFSGVGHVSAPAQVSSEAATALQQGPVVRRLQANVSNATNATVPAEYVSPCVQAVRDIIGLEQCEIDYRTADCDDENAVPWTTLDGPIIWLYGFGVLVMFMSLSVVCDEFFVPGMPQHAHTQLRQFLSLGGTALN